MPIQIAILTYFPPKNAREFSVCAFERVDVGDDEPDRTSVRMLTAIRTDDREKMVILSYASPSGDRPRRARDDAEDTGRALRIKFTNAGLVDKENVDPVTAMTARKPFATPVRGKCTPSRPPLADITPKYVTPVRRETKNVEAQVEFETSANA